MYESLNGHQTTIQKIINSNYQITFSAKLMTQNNSLNAMENRDYNLLGLSQILNQRNNKYIGKKTYLQAPFIVNVPVSYKTIQMPQNQMPKQEHTQVYDVKEQQRLLLQQFQAFYDSRFDCEIQAQDMMTEEQYQQIQPVARIIRYINSQFRNNNGNVQFSTMLLKLMKPGQFLNTIKQFVRHLQIAKQNQNNPTILMKILSDLFQDIKRRKNKQIPLLLNKPTNQQQKKLKIYYLFLFEEGRRTRLNDILFHESQDTIFQLIQKYDNLFDNSVSHTRKQLSQFNHKVQNWAINTKYKPYDYLASALSYNLPLQKCSPMAKNYQFQIYTIIAKTIKWLNIRIDDQKQRQFFYQQIIKNYKQLLQDLFISDHFFILRQQKKKQLYLYLMDYERFLNCITSKQQKLILLLLICAQSQNFTNLFRQTKSNLHIEQIQHQLYINMKQIVQIPSQNQFVTDSLKYLNYKQMNQIILSSKQFIQSIQWKYLSSLFPQQQKLQFKKFMNHIISESVLIYKNTSVFLNMGTDQWPQIQIQTLLKGLAQTLTQNVQMNQEQRHLFYKTISSFRGSSLPQQHFNLMILLEMCLEWYILRQSIYNQDYKMVAQIIKINLQQLQEEDTDCVSKSIINQSSRIKQFQLQHNYQFINKIGNKQFIEYLTNQKPQYQYLYIDYIYTISDGICKLRLIKKKNYRREKMLEWSQLLLLKVSQNLQQTKNIFYRNLSQLKKIISQNLSRCFKN